MNKQAIGYTRVSTDKQVRDGVSLDAQKERIRKFCEFNGYDLVGVFTDEGISGGDIDRPALKHVRSVLRRGMVLVTYSLSRLTRSLKDLITISDELEKKGCDLISLSENIDTTSAAGKMMFQILGVIGEFERRVIGERVSLAKQYKRQRGEFNGGWAAPYGYKVIGDEDKGKFLLEIPEEQEILRAAKELREQRLPLRRIAKELENKGYLARNGKTFKPVQVSRILGEARY